jgi:hypothetical protein
MLITYPETRKEICDALRKLEVSDIDEMAPLHELQHQLATVTYFKTLSNVVLAPCKYLSKIKKVYTVMDTFPADATIQLDQVWKLSVYTGSDKDSGLYIAQTGLERIYQFMKQYPENAHYGCSILHIQFKDQDTSPFLCSNVRAVLDAMTPHASVNMLLSGIGFLHTIVTSSAANAAIVAIEQDAASVIIAAKHALIEHPDVLKTCNAILVCL